ncbi:MAG: hypothetical protein COA42_10955 [Alteromonadaceae bacterium]|nr:MAG: hypothetical protein COA42_10955 [Alteromonadaceae bacterium]
MSKLISVTRKIAIATTSALMLALFSTPLWADFHDNGEAMEEVMVVGAVSKDKSGNNSAAASQKQPTSSASKNLAELPTIVESKDTVK